MYSRRMWELRNICLIDPTPVLADAFRTIGCHVLVLDGSPAPFLSLPDTLDRHGFEPDLVLQREVLGKRCLVTGLDTMACPTVFWAVDPHLNSHWHACYARLFDVTCSTQRAWTDRLAERGAPDVRWLPMYGRTRSWTETADRGSDIAFVGRITDQRPSRKWMVDLIKDRFGGSRLRIEQDLGFEAMMRLYEDTRIVPNESISGEVNFRLFEAASCGCLVLGQDLGDEQGALFEPGREMDTFSHVVEFKEKLAVYLDNDRLTRTMGRAAYKRVQAEHLPEHRARRLLEIAGECTENRVRGIDHAKWLALTVGAMFEAGLNQMPVGEVLNRLAALPQDADVAETTLRLQCMAELDPLVDDNLNAILAGEYYADSPQLNLAASVASLRREKWDWAKAFWYRHLRATGAKNPAAPRSPDELLTCWAKEMKRLGRIVRPGFAFNPDVHLPTTATECLMVIIARDHEHLPTLRLLDTMLRPIAGSDQTRVGLLSVLTLHEREDWRLALEIALVNLRSFRLESGLEELRLAREIARSHGQEVIFGKALAARDGDGRLARAMEN